MFSNKFVTQRNIISRKKPKTQTVNWIYFGRCFWLYWYFFYCILSYTPPSNTLNDGIDIYVLNFFRSCRVYFFDNQSLFTTFSYTMWQKSQLNLWDLSNIHISYSHKNAYWKKKYTLDIFYIYEKFSPVFRTCISIYK